MSLSTSNSKSAVTAEKSAAGTAHDGVWTVRFTWKHMLLVALLTFCVLELLSRSFLFKISKDFSMFAKFPTRARALTAEPGLRVALIGNSTTDDCTDAGVIKAQLEQQLHRPVSVEAFAAGGSMLPTQLHIVNHTFWRTNERPDLYVVTFFNNNQDQLSDSEDMDAGRLGYFFTTPREWPRIFKREVQSPEERIVFMASSASASVAGRRRIADRLSAITVPKYKELMWRVNGANVDHVIRGMKATSRPASYQDLNDLIQGAQARGSAVCFIAYPTRQCVSGQYTISQTSQRIIEAKGATLIDLRKKCQLPYASYKDDIHISKQWAPYYSGFVARAIEPICENIVHGTSPAQSASPTDMATKPRPTPTTPAP